MSNKDFLAQFQGAVSTLKSDGRLVSKGRSSSSSASSSSSTRGGGRGGQTARRPPAQSLRVSTGARGGGGGGGGGQQSGVDVRNGSPKVRRAAAASARRGGPSHRPTVRDLEQFDADDRVAAAHGRFTSHSRSPQQRYQKHSHQQQVYQPPPVAGADSYYGGYHDSGSPDGRALPPQQEQFHHHHQPQQNLPQARHGSGSAHHGHGGGGGGGGGGGDFDDGGYSSGRSGGGSGHGHSSHGSGGGRSGGGAGGYYEGEDSSYYAPPPQRKLSSSTKSRKKQAPRQDDGAFRELSHLKQKDYKSDGLREKRLEKLVKTSKDQLFYSKKARAVTDFKPKTLKDYKATKATGYQVIPSLQPDLEDPELVRKKAIKARQKEFSQRLNEVNRQVIQSAGPPKKKAAPKVVTKFDKMKEYAARVPKPKVQPIRPSPSAGAAGRSPGRRRRQDGGDDDDDDGYDDDEHMQAQSNIEQLLLMRENFAAEIEDMKREYTA